MSNIVNWGILGAAQFAREQMAPAILAASGARLAALATSSPDKAAPFQQMAPDLRVISDYQALLDDPTIDAVYIPLPNHMHADWTLRAIAAGKHVLCEKPIGMSTGEIDQLIAARDASGIMVAEAYMILHHPQWIRAKEIVDRGEIGTLRHVEAVFTFDNRDGTNIRNRPETGGGGIRDIGVYTYGSTRYITGAEPSALSAKVDFENGVDVYAHVTGMMDDGVTISILNAIRMAPRQGITFHGDKGRMTLPTPFNAQVFGEARILVECPGGVIREERFSAARHYQLQIENFGAAIAGDRAAYPVPLEFSRGTQAMIDQVFACANP